MGIFSRKNNEVLKSTQNMLPILGMDRGFIVTEDNRLVQILKVSAINTELMSENELYTLYENYEAFLKSIASDLQIKIVSEPINLSGYIKSQEELLGNAENPFQKELLKGYIDYMKGMDASRQTYRRQRYVVFHEKIKGETEKDYEQAIDNVKGKAEDVFVGLKELKLECEFLTNTDIVRYFHILFNYEHALHERIEPNKIKKVTIGNRGFRTLRPKEKVVTE